MAHPVLEPELVDGRHGIATTDHARRPTVSDGPGHALRALREGVDLEDTHRPVPEDRAGTRDVSPEKFDRLRSYVQAHVARWNGVYLDRLGLSALLHRICDDHVNGQDQPIAGLAHEALRLLQIVVLDERIADLIPQRLEEREAHGAAHEQGVSGPEQALNDTELVRDLSPPEDGDEGALRGFENRIEVIYLLLKEQPRRGWQPLRHPDRRCVRPVGGAERVVDVEVGEGSELVREPWVVLGLAWIEPGVLEQHDATTVPTVESLLYLGTDRGIELLDRFTEQFLEPRGHGVHGVPGIRLTLRTSEVGDQNRTCSLR